VRLASQLFEDLRDIRCFVGAGEMIDLAATHFAAANQVDGIANRTMERGRKIANTFCGR
jgi:glutamyl-tRNA reductase